MNNYKRITLENRVEIEKSLDNGESLNAIAKKLNRSLSSISREVKRNRYIKDYYSCGSRNRCVFRYKCMTKDLCPGIMYLVI